MNKPKKLYLVGYDDDANPVCNTENPHGTDTEYIRSDLAGVQWREYLSIEDDAPPRDKPILACDSQCKNIAVFQYSELHDDFVDMDGNLIRETVTHWAEINLPNG